MQSVESQLDVSVAKVIVGGQRAVLRFGSEADGAASLQMNASLGERRKIGLGTAGSALDL